MSANPNMVGFGQSPEDAFEDPFFQFNQAMQQFQQQQQNQRQSQFNRISQRESGNQQARLGLQGMEQLQSGERYLHGLLQDLANSRFSTLIQGQQAGRSLMDLTSDLASTRYNVERTGLTDELRLLEAQTLLNDLLNGINQNAPGTRARQLLGVRA